jgi:hypothetical protein
MCLGIGTRVKKTCGTRFLRKVQESEEGQARIPGRNVAYANKYELLYLIS